MTDERVNTQGVKMLHMLKEREICCNLSAGFSGTMHLVLELKKCFHACQGGVTLFLCVCCSELATMTYLMLSATEDLQMKDNDLRSVRNKTAVAGKEN